MIAGASLGALVGLVLVIATSLTPIEQGWGIVVASIVGIVSVLVGAVVGDAVTRAW